MPKRVVVYTQPNCAPCDKLKSYLTERGVEFTARDVSTDAEALEELTRFGYMATPITVIDGEAVVGFDRKQLESLLQVSIE